MDDIHSSEVNDGRSSDDDQQLQAEGQNDHHLGEAVRKSSTKPAILPSLRPITRSVARHLREGGVEDVFNFTSDGNVAVQEAGNGTVLANPLEGNLAGQESGRANTEFNSGNHVGLRQGEAEHEVTVGNLRPVTRAVSRHLREAGVADDFNFLSEGNVGGQEAANLNLENHPLDHGGRGAEAVLANPPEGQESGPANTEFNPVGLGGEAEENANVPHQGIGNVRPITRSVARHLREAGVKDVYNFVNQLD